MPVEETTQAQAVDGQQDAPAQAVDAPEFDLAGYVVSAMIESQK